MSVSPSRWKAVAVIAAMAMAMAIAMSFAIVGTARAVENGSIRVAQASEAGDSGSSRGGRSIIVFAAASLTDVLGEIDKAFTAKTGVGVKESFAASSALARQIENGAKAEVFFSADEEWMDYLATRNLLQPNSRHDVVGNRLVLIAPVDSTAKVTLEPGFSVSSALGATGRLATGDPDSVPVGRYAQAALTKLGAWNAISPRLVRAENVRSALAYVARREAPLGIVYETDAKAEKRVKVVGIFPASSHAPIRYPIAVTMAGTGDAAKYVEFVRGPESAVVFRKYGFEPVSPSRAKRP